MTMLHLSTSPTSTESSSFPQDVNRDNHPRSQSRLDPRSVCERSESQPRKINLPPFSVLWNTLTEPWPTSVPSSSRPFKYENYQPRLPSPCPDCTGRPLPPLTRPHSARARYKPYSLGHPSTSKKPLNPRTFVDARDIEQCFHHRGEYLSHTGHGPGCSHSNPGRYTDFSNFAAPRPCTTEVAVPHYVKDHVCPCWGCPVRERHYSDPAGKYLNVPELPSRRGTRRAHARYPASHDDHKYPRAYTPRNMRRSQPQARSVGHSDILKYSSDHADSDHDCSEREDDEPVGGEKCGSPLTVNPQPSKSPIPDEQWRKHCINMGKDTRTGANVYRCHYLVVKDDRPAEPCDREGAKNTIKRHFDTVHLRIRDYKCTICPVDPHNGPKAFGQRQGLRVHINAVHPEIGPYEPFPCKFCPEKFADPSQRHKHCKSQHPEVEIKKRRKFPYAYVS